jgi:hypothetical protein
MDFLNPISTYLKKCWTLPVFKDILHLKIHFRLGHEPEEKHLFYFGLRIILPIN